MVVDQLVARRAEHHEVAQIIDVLRAFPRTAAWSVGAEGDDMGNFCEIPFFERDVVFEKVFVAAVEFTAAPGPHEKNEAVQRRNTPRRLDGRGYVSSLAGLWAGARVHAKALPITGLAGLQGTFSSGKRSAKMARLCA